MPCTDTTSAGCAMCGYVSCRCPTAAGPPLLADTLSIAPGYCRTCLNQISGCTCAVKVKSDGGATSYYEIPAGATECQDIIEAKKMAFGRGEMFKAIWRLGEKDGTTEEYDLNKVIYFANRRKAELARG